MSILKRDKPKTKTPAKKGRLLNKKPSSFAGIYRTSGSEAVVLNDVNNIRLPKDKIGTVRYVVMSSDGTIKKDGVCDYSSFDDLVKAIKKDGKVTITSLVADPKSKIGKELSKAIYKPEKWVVAYSTALGSGTTPLPEPTQKATPVKAKPEPKAKPTKAKAEPKPKVKAEPKPAKKPVARKPRAKSTINPDDYLDRFEIYEKRGNEIHTGTYFYNTGDDEDDSYRQVYMSMDVPIKDLANYRSYEEDRGSDYLDDLTEAECKERIIEAFTGVKYLPYNKITLDTPDGTYYSEHITQVDFSHYNPDGTNVKPEPKAPAKAKTIKEWMKENPLNFTKAREWRITAPELMELISIHEVGTSSQRQWIEDVLEDINFHTLNSYLADGDYKKAKYWLEQEYDVTYPGTKDAPLKPRTVNDATFDIAGTKWSKVGENTWAYYDPEYPSNTYVIDYIPKTREFSGIVYDTITEEELVAISFSTDYLIEGKYTPTLKNYGKYILDAYNKKNSLTKEDFEKALAKREKIEADHIKIPTGSKLREHRNGNDLVGWTYNDAIYFGTLQELSKDGVDWINYSIYDKNGNVATKGKVIFDVKVKLADIEKRIVSEIAEYEKKKPTGVAPAKPETKPKTPVKTAPNRVIGSELLSVIADTDVVSSNVPLNTEGVVVVDPAHISMAILSKKNKDGTNLFGLTPDTSNGIYHATTKELKEAIDPKKSYKTSIQMETKDKGSFILDDGTKKTAVPFSYTAYQEMRVPRMNWDKGSSGTIDPAEFKKYVKQSAKLGNKKDPGHTRIIINPDKVRINGSSDFNAQTPMVRFGADVGQKVKTSQPVMSSFYPTDYLASITKSLKTGDKAQIHLLEDDAPLKLEILGRDAYDLEYLVAPRIMADEEKTGEKKYVMPNFNKRNGRRK